MNKKCINIIKLLISASDYLSSYEIATACAISQRSVRVEMKNIKQILLSLNYTLVSEPSKGYKILENYPENLSSLFDFLNTEEKQRESLFPTVPIERGSYILKRLIESEDYIKIDDLADELASSRSTIVQNIQYIKPRILNNNLKLQQKPNFGLKITGDESSLRRLLCDLLFLNLNHSDMLYDFLNAFISYPNTTEYHVIEILNKYDIAISDIGLCDFLLSLIVNINRIINRKYVILEQDISIIENRIELVIAKEICDYLSIKNNINFTQDEITLIAIQLICKCSSKRITTPNRIASQISTEILNEIKTKTLLTFTNTDFLNEFMLNIEDSIIRLHFNEKIRTPLFDSSSIIYPLGYELALISSKVIEKHIHKTIFSSELATYSIFFDMAINDNYYSKKNVLLIYSYGVGSARLLEKKILQEFNNDIIIKKLIPFYKLHNEDLSSYDFIISTGSIHQDLDIQCIILSNSFSSLDIKKIDNYLKYYCKNLNLELIFHPKLFNNHVRVNSFKDLIHIFYLQISKMYPYIKKVTFSSLFNSSNCDYNFYDNNICFLKTHKAIHINTILSVIIAEKPLLFKGKKVRIFIFLSSTDTSNYIYNSINNLLTHVDNSHNKFKLSDSNPSYVEFIKIMKSIYDDNDF